MPKHYMYTCDKCEHQERRYRNVSRCECGGNLIRNIDNTRLQLTTEVMKYLNDREEYWLHVFDCGSLGILKIWFGRSWCTEWLEPIKLPDEVFKCLE